MHVCMYVCLSQRMMRHQIRFIHPGTHARTSEKSAAGLLRSEECTRSEDSSIWLSDCQAASLLVGEGT